MIKGVTRPEEVAHLGLSNRLLARVGALLKKNLTLSLALLESAAPRTELETFLLKPELLRDARTLDQNSLLVLAAQSNLPIPLGLLDDNSARIVFLEEERDAGGWGGAPTAFPPAAIRPQPNLAASDRRRGEDDGGILTPDFLSRARLKLAAGVVPAERIEALRTLLFADLRPAEKAQILLEALADPDAAVRTEAGVLLATLGVSAVVSSAIADLNRDDPARRIAAAERLDKIARASTRAVDSPPAFAELEESALIISAMSLLKSDAALPLKIRLLSLLSSSAALLGRNAGRLTDLLRVLVGMLAFSVKRSGASSTEVNELFGAATALLKQLGKLFPEALQSALDSERLRAPDSVTESFMLGILFDLVPPGAAGEAELLAQSAAYLARDIEEGRDSRAIGAAMTRRGSAALQALVTVFDGATPGARRHILILLDEICRGPAATSGDLDSAARVVIAAIESGAKVQRMAAMECRLVFDPRVSAELRGRLAERFLDSTGDYSFSFDIEKVESAVARMGVPAVPVLIARLSSTRPPNERARAARLLGEAALRARAEPGEFQHLQSVLTDASRALESASLEASFPDKGEVFAALGKLIASPAVAMEAGDVVRRTLFAAASAGDPQQTPRALEGIAWLAASRRAQPELIDAAVKILAGAIDAADRDDLISVEHVSAGRDGEKLYELRGGESYAIALPLVVQGLERIALASNTSPAMLARIGTLLLSHWRDLCSGARIWGPVSTHLLVETLQYIALSEKCGMDLRIGILNGLLPRLAKNHVMKALAEILAAHDVAPLSGIALGVGFATLARRDANGRFEREDRPEILHALGLIAQRQHLAAPPSETQRTPDEFRRLVVQETQKASQDSIPGAAKLLATLAQSEAIPPTLRAEIQRRL